MPINKAQENLLWKELGLVKELRQQFPNTMDTLNFWLESGNVGSLNVKNLYEQNAPWFNEWDKRMNLSNLELEYIQVCISALEKELKNSNSKIKPLLKLLDLIVKDNVSNNIAAVITWLYANLLNRNQ